MTYYDVDNKIIFRTFETKIGILIEKNKFKVP